MPEQAELSESLQDSHADAANPNAEGTEESAERNAERKKKRKDKIRSAWISFVGRIVAQFVGATASILLGLMFLQKYQAIATKSGSSGNVKPAASAEAPLAPVKERRLDGHVSIAVLPFENFSPDPKQEALANGMTEALIAGLSRADGLRVTSRTSSMHYKGLRLPLPEIGRELGVDLIVEGSIVKSGERVRVIVQLIDVDTDEHVWADHYDRLFKDVLSLQSDVARAIVRDLNAVVARGPEKRRSPVKQRVGIVDCGVSGYPASQPERDEPSPACQSPLEDSREAPAQPAELAAPSSTPTRRP
jgi:TolB-like protein